MNLQAEEDRALKEVVRVDEGSGDGRVDSTASEEVDGVWSTLSGDDDHELMRCGWCVSLRRLV